MKKYRLILFAAMLSLSMFIGPLGFGEAISKPVVLKSLIMTPPMSALSRSFDAYMNEV